MNTLELIEPETRDANDQETPELALRLPLGLLGFQQVKNYALYVNPKESPLLTLQMLEGDKFTFRVALASVLLPDYQPDISDADVEFLGLTNPDDAVVFNIVTLRCGLATVNLTGPIVVNRHSMIGKQVIPANAHLFDSRHPLDSSLQEKMEEIRLQSATGSALAARAARLARQPKSPAKTRESKLAHQYLDGLEGLEIGGGAHNPFGLKTRNVDFCGDLNTIFKLEEESKCGEKMKVDVVAPGDDLPISNESVDFVISSHVIEHFFDPIKAIKEWLRVIRPGGFIFIIAPHKERTFDSKRPRTPLQELLDRHSGRIPAPAVDTHEHYSVWITQDLLDLCQHMKWNVVEHLNIDDKVGNGFTVLIKKPLEARPVSVIGA